MTCQTADGEQCALIYDRDRVVGIRDSSGCGPSRPRERRATFCASPLFSKPVAFRKGSNGTITFTIPPGAENVVIRAELAGASHTKTLEELQSSGSVQTQGNVTTIQPGLFTEDVVLTLSATCKTTTCGEGYFELLDGERIQFSELPKIHRLITEKGGPLPWKIHLAAGSNFKFLVSRSDGDFTCKVTLPPARVGDYVDEAVCTPGRP